MVTSAASMSTVPTGHLLSPYTDYLGNYYAAFVFPSGVVDYYDGLDDSYGRILRTRCILDTISILRQNREKQYHMMTHTSTFPTVSYLNTSKRSILLEV